MSTLLAVLGTVQLVRFSTVTACTVGHLVSTVLAETLPI